MDKQLEKYLSVATASLARDLLAQVGDVPVPGTVVTIDFGDLFGCGPVDIDHPEFVEKLKSIIEENS